MDHKKKKIRSRRVCTYTKDLILNHLWRAVYNGTCTQPHLGLASFVSGVASAVRSASELLHCELLHDQSRCSLGVATSRDARLVSRAVATLAATFAQFLFL